MTVTIPSPKVCDFNRVLRLLPSADSGRQSPFLIRFLLLPMIRSILTNMYEMEKMLQKTDDINWTVVRPPGLKNQPASGRPDALWPGVALEEASFLSITVAFAVLCRTYVGKT